MGDDLTGKSYRDELMRADPRPDAEELRRKVAVYHEYYRTYGKAKEAFLDAHADDIEAFQFTDDDPNLGLALAALRASMYDEPDFLFLVAAGPLEDILRKPDQDILARVLVEARKSARFRWMLTGIFLHAIPDVARPEIVLAIGTMTEADPMPPR
ncbi:DUF6869 domain-containing protein [Sphingomonas endolithica]|uniref:DUF6869 domain-containing protein n=1 Tax=Sphingomonas endolithica TaxID=2972485 RepID=UPI0021AFBA00|nr:hypothetical protein [Sphingomonas sp. ZFBP2030]